jgi:hypothetical protein
MKSAATGKTFFFRSRHRRYSWWGAFVLVPPLVYPLYAGFWLAHDSLLGDAQAWHLLLYESRLNLWRTFWSDWAHSLVVFYALGAGLLPLVIMLNERPRRLAWLSAAGIVIGMVAAWHLSGVLFQDATLVLAICGGLSAAAFGMLAFAGRSRARR